MDKEPKEPTAEQIEAARRAVMGAPMTETGIVIPPYVKLELDAKDADRDREEAGGPAYNRAQRRAHERRLRKIQKRDAKRLDRQGREALEKLQQATEGLSDRQLAAAMGTVKALGRLPHEEHERILEDLDRGTT